MVEKKLSFDVPEFPRMTTFPSIIREQFHPARLSIFEERLDKEDRDRLLNRVKLKLTKVEKIPGYI